MAAKTTDIWHWLSLSSSKYQSDQVSWVVVVVVVRIVVVDLYSASRSACNALTFPLRREKTRFQSRVGFSSLSSNGATKFAEQLSKKTYTHVKFIHKKLNR